MSTKVNSPFTLRATVNTGVTYANNRPPYFIYRPPIKILLALTSKVQSVDYIAPNSRAISYQFRRNITPELSPVLIKFTIGVS